jgi:hypothetical protein
VRTCLLISAAFLLLSRPTFAQNLEPSLATLLERHARLIVLDTNGSEWTGRLLNIDDAAVTLATPDGPLSVARGRVAEIYRRGDSVVSGITIGAVTGAALGVWFTKETGCGAMLSGYEPCSAREYAASVAITTGLGAGIGLGLDALVRGRTRIYPTETRGFWPTVNLAPQVSPRHAAIVASTRW